MVYNYFNNYSKKTKILALLVVGLFGALVIDMVALLVAEIMIWDRSCLVIKV